MAIGLLFIDQKTSIVTCQKYIWIKRDELRITESSIKEIKGELYSVKEKQLILRPVEDAFGLSLYYTYERHIQLCSLKTCYTLHGVIT